ncbi:MAG TPA: BTAD domain-containing putative transcriptional regulator [Mycobacterium sp.]|nr:BTAD domain-containing putative transcriptional regulator [Mycobacterium sp.]
MELGVLGPLQVRQDGAPVAVPGAKPRAILTMLGLHGGSVVSADTLIELLWGEDPPRTAAKALQTHISSLRRALGDGFVLTAGAGWTLAESEVDAARYKSAARRGRDAATAGDTSQAVARFEEALGLWRGVPELPDGRRGTSEKTRWMEGHAALVEDRLDALLATGRAAEVVGDLEAAVADAPLRERRWGQLMLALYRAGRQGEALSAYQRARSLLADELGVDPGPELRRLEAAIVAQDASLDVPVAQNLSVVTRAVTFLLTDIEGSTAAWEADANAMGVALARHDELVEQVVTSRGGRLIKTRGEGDATFSVFERPSAAAAAAIELQDAIVHEPWALAEPMRIRVALHTGEAELRDGDYFGRAVNRAARLRSLAEGGQILCSGATAELVIDSLSDDVVLTDLGMRQLKNLARPEHVFELRLDTDDEHRQEVPPEAPIQRPALPAVLAGPGPFVGRGRELARLFSAWQTTLAGGTNAVLVAGEPGVGKTRLSGEWSRQAYDQGALVIYGRCDEDLGAPYQPFAEALRSLVPCLGAQGLRGLRGVEALLALVPGLTDVLPDLAAPTRADPDTERFALFDAVVALLGLASAGTPVVLILDDLHWAAKPTLLLLRHLLRFGDQARVQIVGTYRSTDLDRSHPLAAMLADLHRDGTASRIALSGLDEDDVTAYVAEVGYDDEELARALATVTGGNPFFLIEALRHVEESGGHWDPSTLPQGVREAVTRRLSRLTPETNKALGAAAVVGSRFGLELVERVVGEDLVDAFDEACKAGIVIEEPGGNYRFNHALVRQSLLAELASVRRMRLHQRIATTLETQPGADDELLAELAYHYFECAWAGNAAKAVDYCRRAADQAMARLGYEAAADLYDRALHALEEIDEELPDRDDQATELMVARCEALLAAGDVTTAAGAVSQLQRATSGSARLAAWATCFDGELSMLTNPERLDEIDAALGTAAAKLAELGDAAGEAKAHTVRAACLARLGRVGDCEVALDDALTAARRAGEHRRVNAVLAGAPLAALWGPNPVPRAGGRCLDVVRLLRITTDSPAVEATSTRCQAVLEAFRGRAEAARRMIDSARRTVTELGLRHALLEVEQFAGIVELVVDDPATAEPHLRQAYNGFRRMGLDADTAETAALLGRACLSLGEEAEADELCTESERLAGHALKPAIAWRMLRARLLSRRADHDEARRMAEAAVALAERTDALVDHGDACLALATVLGVAGDIGASRSAAEQAVDLYERKGAAALAEKARGVLGEQTLPTTSARPKTPVVEIHTLAVQASERLMAAINREAWDEFEQMVAPESSVESRRKVVGFRLNEFRSDEVMRQTRRDLETGILRMDHAVIAVRGERLAIARIQLGTPDVSPGAPQDELLQLYAVGEDGRIILQVWFDLDDMDAAIAELDTLQTRFEEERPASRRPENAATRLYERFKVCFAARDWGAIAEMLSDNLWSEDRRRVVNSGVRHGRDALIAELSAIAEVGIDVTSDVVATRGEHLVLSRVQGSGQSQGPDAFYVPTLDVIELDADERAVARIVFDLDNLEAAIAELDARYLAGEAAPYRRPWSVIAEGYAALNRCELPAATPDAVNIDHRRAAAFAPGEGIEYLRAGWDLGHTPKAYVEAVHRLNDLGAVVTHRAYGTSPEGFDAEWRTVSLLMTHGDALSRFEIFGEAGLDTAIAKFEQLSRPVRRLENAASRLYERFKVCFAAGDWGAIAEMLSENLVSEDRRRVVNSGVRQGRDAMVAELSAMAEVGIDLTSDVIATRGEHLVLIRVQASGQGQGPDAFSIVAFNVNEIDADERLVARIVFDLDDFDAAIAELDRRYLAGEAAANAHTWSVVVRAYESLARRELSATTPNWVNLDHRRGIAFAPGDLIPYLREIWDEESVSSFIETVHRLNHLGAIFVQVAKGTSREGFDAERRVVNLLTVEGELIDGFEIFDEADLDAAIAKFEQLHRPVRRLENAASRLGDRYVTYLAAGDCDAIAGILADNFSNDDRRRLVGNGVTDGRDAQVATMRVIADVFSTNVTGDIVATRGRNLALGRITFSVRDEAPDAFLAEIHSIVEIDADEKIASIIVFDLDDFDAAIAELDRRYIAGEAAAHSHTWSVIVRAYWSLIRHELPPTTANWVNLDHRRGVAFAPGDMTAYLRDMLESEQSTGNHIEVVHRLNDLGAVFIQVIKGTSQDGLDAEWRLVTLMTVEGDLVSRAELFDEADLDAAIARLDELSRPTPRLENTSSQVANRFLAYFEAGDWDAMANVLADNVCNEDRRRVVGGEVRHGRDAQIADMRATAELWTTSVTQTVMATRGKNLNLMRNGFASRDDAPEKFVSDVYTVGEIDADERIASIITFDLDDLDAAIAELDARYLAGEAAAHAHTWSIISGAYAAMNRHELFPTTPDWANVDHRRPGIIEKGGLNASLVSLWSLIPDVTFQVEAVHRLSELGAVCAHVAHGVSRDGFNAEWRGIEVITVDGQLINRCEIFDDGDLDVALTRFEELHPHAPRLENAASRADERFFDHTRARSWAAAAEILADNSIVDDRRRVVNIGIWDGRDAVIANIRALAEAVAHVTSTAIAIRGEHLALTRICAPNRDSQQGDFGVEMLCIAELDADERLSAHVMFDLDDFDTAITELDARYLAGEAAACSRAWSVIAEAFAGFNRNELPPTTKDPVYIDHRPLASIEGTDLAASLRALLDLTSDVSVYIEAVHRLTEIGAVTTQVVMATWQEGADTELRMIAMFTVEAGLISRAEVFDEADLDTALARFEELQPQLPRLENAASRAHVRLNACIAARDWNAASEILADDIAIDDRRRVVNAGIQYGRDATIANLRGAIDLGLTNISPIVTATRGDRLELCRTSLGGQDGPDAFRMEFCSVHEIDADERIVARVVFDRDDFETAIAELDARYLAGEAAAYWQTWSVITQAYAAVNRGELAPTTPEWVNIDHRRGIAFAPGEMTAYIRVGMDLTPYTHVYVETVHRIDSLGAVFTQVLTGTSQEGFDAEWREIGILTVDGDVISRAELFDEADLDAALARFDELHVPIPQLDNAAIRLWARLVDAFNRRDVEAYLAGSTADIRYEDRRKGLRDEFEGPAEQRKAVLAMFGATPDSVQMTSEPIAIRGSRLSLTRVCYRDTDYADRPITVEMIQIVEIGDSGLLDYCVSFDPDDIDAAFAELDARYMAGEAAPYARTWSAMARTCAAFNHGELPATTPDSVYADHRPVLTVDAVNLPSYLRAMWDVTPDIRVEIEAVHRLSELGSVVTHVVKSTSPEGFNAEWRGILIYTLEADMVNRSEAFDEADLDAALARFDELDRLASS